MATAELDEKTVTTNVVPDYFVRFVPRQRVEHIVLMVSFIVLAVTGLAQKYSSAGWGEWVIMNLGGIAYTRLIHRAFGLLFSLGAVYHFAFLGYSLLIRHARPSMLPTLKDFQDVVATLRYSFGFIENPPQYGRYDYRQKFEYWGLIFGSLMIIVTGFILVYPFVITNVLSGQFVAAARELHGYEATLAVVVIVIWHLYDVIFKPGVFPGDFSIFTGKISRKRLIEEHTIEYNEIVGTKENSEETPAELSSGDVIKA